MNEVNQIKRKNITKQERDIAKTKGEETCVICDKAYNGTNLKNTQISIQHEDCTLNCKICVNVFNTNCTMKRHI